MSSPAFTPKVHRQLDAIREEGPSAYRRQAEFVESLRALADEVRLVAPMWRPFFEDGVVLNAAPLWRLFLHKPWQGRLERAWIIMQEGAYDWSRMAMHLWPERVIPKCATDLSLAIAHGLEEVYWVEERDGKWSPRATPTRSTEDLIKERTSAAVKSALKAMLEAPIAASHTRRRGRGRVSRAGSE